MSVRSIRRWIWAGSLASGALLSLLISFFTPDGWYIIGGLLIFLISGRVLDQAVHAYSAKRRSRLTKKEVFLMGMAGPAYIFGEAIKEILPQLGL